MRLNGYAVKRLCGVAKQLNDKTTKPRFYGLYGFGMRMVGTVIPTEMKDIVSENTSRCARRYSECADDSRNECTDGVDDDTPVFF